MKKVNFKYTGKKIGGEIQYNKVLYLNWHIWAGKTVLYGFKIDKICNFFSIFSLSYYGNGYRKQPILVGFFIALPTKCIHQWNKKKLTLRGQTTKQFFYLSKQLIIKILDPSEE